MGKSTCGALARKFGVKLVDTDNLARDLVEPGQTALVEISQAFGKELLDGAGRLRRELLAERVFSNTSLRRQLEAILHPKIQERWTAQFDQWRINGADQAAVVIPLLFETNTAHLFDLVICVACSEQTQRERVADRGWSLAELSRRQAAQLPVSEKMARATHVIWAEGKLTVHALQLQRILRVASRFPAPPGFLSEY